MRTLISSLILVAITIGAGMFALPYVFYNSGWLIGFFYFLILGVFLIFVHYFYSEVIFKTNKFNLLELISENFSNFFKIIAFIIIFFGLILTLVIYLILGGNFLKIIFNNLNYNIAVLIFWLICSTSLIKRSFLKTYEIWGALLMILIISILFLFSLPQSNLNLKLFDFKEFFLPFGPVLFALTGWTAIAPMIKINPSKNEIKNAIILGAILIIFFYLLFIFGILNLSKDVKPDALSGVILNQKWLIIFLALLGILAIWTSYLSIAIEIEKTIEKYISFKAAFLIMVFVPFFIFLLGAKNFLTVLSFTGGVFLAGQYLLMLLLIRKILEVNIFLKILIKILELIFISAIIYEIYFVFN